MSADISQIRIIQNISKINRQDWNQLANPSGQRYDPFLDWDFLEALESSGAVSPETGWIPQHLIADDPAGKPVAAMSLYLKLHSQGEYVFDHGWAEAFEHSGGRYYPKLLCAVPFTPVTGRRILVRPGAEALFAPMAQFLIQLCQDNDLSSCHVNFVPEAEQASLLGSGFLAREDQQFHWHNRQYDSFEHFLQTLTSRKRKNLKKERRQIAQSQIRFEQLTGSALQSSHWDAFFAFYQNTGDRKWGFPYLNRQFFELIHARMADKILLILAMEDNDYIAGALNFIGSDTLYGRYWGRSKEHPFLHFETCYYQAMEFAIANRLARIEAGAQGEHKLARGYEPQTIRSAHWITHPGLRRAVADYLQHEVRLSRQQGELLEAHSPFAREFLPSPENNG